ncbi:amidohydrolase family protein, partial [Acidobacteria bacterium AH-259-D05]|nr:amidohydrolase family protein [Acidobacteria bacterium AH-259-D05]
FFFSFRVALAQGANQLPEEVIRYAEVVLHNGKIHTVDRDGTDYSVVEAVAIRDGKFVAAGEEEDVLVFSGPNTVKVDLKGRTVVPGFIDTHSHLFPLPPSQDKGQWWARFRLEARSVEEKQRALQEISELANYRRPSDWLIVNTDNNLIRTFTLEELDKAVPNNPLFVGGTPSHGAVNSPTLEKLLEAYPNIEGVSRDAEGRFTGQLRTPAVGVVRQEFLPEAPAEVMGPLYKRVIDAWARTGITTWSSRIMGAELSRYIWLDRKGMMTTRFAYAHQWLMDNPHYRSYVRRLTDFVGLGSEMIWNVGASIVSVDTSTPNQCVSVEKQKPAGYSGPLGDCYALPGMLRYEALKEALLSGMRVSGVHAAGDRSTDHILDLFLEINERRNIKDLRPVLDHCTMLSQDNISKAKNVPGMMFSCAPKYIFGTAKVVGDVWGDEIAHRWVVPTRSLLEAGLKVVWEIDLRTNAIFKGFPEYHPMFQMQTLVTRKDVDGKLWGPHEKIDRRTGLLMMTRWGAEYVLRENDLGSIETGKLADLVMLDGDFLAVADSELVDLATLMTMIGGKVVYIDPEFAGEIGSDHEKILHPYATKSPAHRPSRELLEWATSDPDPM